MLWSKNMWKGYESHFIWEKVAIFLAAGIVIAAWILLCWKLSDWIIFAFRGMFL